MSRAIILEAEVKQQESDPIDIEYIDKIAIVYSADGTSTPSNGATVRFSNDGINWVPAAGVSLGTLVIPEIISGLCYKWAQVTMDSSFTNYRVYLRGTSRS